MGHLTRRRVMGKRRSPFAVMPLDDESTFHPSRVLAVVRYDGDPDVFAALAAVWMREEGYDEAVMPPRPRLFRWNPDPTGYHEQVLAEAARPGRGVWLGSRLERARPTGTGPVALGYCNVCDAHRGERHTERCVLGRLMGLDEGRL